ncbi:hypothetical protein BH10BAC1_BH10BAC1_07150 [soil metagenome]
MAKKKIKTIVWSKNAEKQFYEILEYLSKEAPEAIDMVGNTILNKVESLETSFNQHPKDRFKKKNDNTYRAAVILSYRISYKVDVASVNILRIRHTSREPLQF